MDANASACLKSALKQYVDVQRRSSDMWRFVYHILQWMSVLTVMLNVVLLYNLKCLLLKRKISWKRYYIVINLCANDTLAGSMTFLLTMYKLYGTPNMENVNYVRSQKAETQFATFIDDHEYFSLVENTSDYTVSTAVFFRSLRRHEPHTHLLLPMLHYASIWGPSLSYCARSILLYLAVAHPLTYAYKLQKRHIYLIISASWVLWILLCTQEILAPGELFHCAGLASADRAVALFIGRRFFVWSLILGTLVCYVIVSLKIIAQRRQRRMYSVYEHCFIQHFHAMKRVGLHIIIFLLTTVPYMCAYSYFAGHLVKFCQQGKEQQVSACSFIQLRTKYVEAQYYVSIITPLWFSRSIVDEMLVFIQSNVWNFLFSNNKGFDGNMSRTQTIRRKEARELTLSVSVHAPKVHGTHLTRVSA